MASARFDSYAERMLKLGYIRRLLIVGVIIGLLLGFGVATWMMFQYRDRLHALWVNQRWEQSLQEAGLFEDRIIVFFGDSQLAGWRVAASFGMLPIKNRGLSGDHASRAVQRFHRDVIDQGATLVVILIGINDLGRATAETVDSVAGHIDRLVSLSLEHDIEVLLCSLLPLQSPYYRPHRAERVLELNEWISRREGVTHVDFYSVLEDDEGRMAAGYTDDGLHPNEDGYMIMTRVLMPHLIRHLQP